MSVEPQYRIEFIPSAFKSLQALGSKLRSRIAAAIEDLSAEPRPPGHQKLKGRKDQYRIRSGKYRVIYKIDDRLLLISVLSIEHRRNAYRK
jgi:mRNA interferase RelE/StbE